MDKYVITDQTERSQFFAQVSHESGNFLFYRELASGKDYDITVNPRKAKDLGNDQPGDGPKYKGRGGIQVTGKNNYRECGSYINKNLVAEPALLERSDLGSESAIWYWVKRVRPQMAKRVNSKSYIKSGKPRTPIDFTNTCLVTHIINGGFNGLQDRLVKF
jgi:putative chitinase